MDIGKILRDERLRVKPSKEELKILKRDVDGIVSLLELEIKKQGVNADVFIGGSFAKGTLLKREDYDIDIFIRFDWRLKDITLYLEKIVNGVAEKIKKGAEKLHGSRDYFRIYNGKVMIEIIPVYKVKKPKEARNVTDFSYFHVNYVKKKIKKAQIADDILLAKSFCKAQGVYGAESYINGFSGYGLECLIINYSSFLKMLKALVKIKIGGRIILDPEKYYKNKNDVLFSLNEARIQSPIVLVDPTWKERNVLAALNKESFSRFQQKAKEFLRRPSEKFFETNEKDLNKLKEIARKKNAEFIHIEIETDRQEGDIAGTKMKKFSRFLESQLKKYFEIFDRKFSYSNGKKANFYLAVKHRGKILIYGPPVEMKKHAKAFKAKHKNYYEKDGKLYSEMKVDFSAKRFLERFGEENKTKIGEMGIVGMMIN